MEIPKTWRFTLIFIGSSHQFLLNGWKKTGEGDDDYELIHQMASESLNDCLQVITSAIELEKNPINGRD